MRHSTSRCDQIIALIDECLAEYARFCHAHAAHPLVKEAQP